MDAKRSLDEFLLIYQIEPSLCDLFCEGPSDALIFRDFVGAMMLNDTAVYSADQIEWPNSLGSYGGNRARLVFLSGELASRKLRGLCIIDKDLDTIADHTPGNACLLKSDYSCIDMYGLDVTDLRAYIYVTYNLSISEEQILAIFLACKHLFLIRFLRERHCAGASIASAQEIFTDLDNVTFSSSSYLLRCKQINGYDARWDVVIGQHVSLFKTMSNDFRDYINIHDLGEMLVAFIRHSKKRSISLRSDFIVKHCSYVLLSNQLFGYPLFSEISTRFA